MNLRQIHLLYLGATPGEIGSVFALIALAGGLLRLSAGVLADRIGPKQVILGAWLLAFAGAFIAALAQTWSFAGAGYVIFMPGIAANPATVSYVLLNTADHEREGSAEAVMATVFASWPAAMIFAPALGGLIADGLNIQANLWIGAAGLLLAVGVFALADNTQPTRVKERSNPLVLVGNWHFVTLAVFFSIALTALYLGYAGLVPTYLEDVTRLLSRLYRRLVLTLVSRDAAAQKRGHRISTAVKFCHSAKCGLVRHAGSVKLSQPRGSPQSVKSGPPHTPESNTDQQGDTGRQWTEHYQSS